MGEQLKLGPFSSSSFSNLGLYAKGHTSSQHMVPIKGGWKLVISDAHGIGVHVMTYSYKLALRPIVNVKWIILVHIVP